jgi:hypothetical protein
MYDRYFDHVHPSVAKKQSGIASIPGIAVAAISSNSYAQIRRLSGSRKIQLVSGQ